jgi:hypothetical protein
MKDMKNKHFWRNFSNSLWLIFKNFAFNGSLRMRNDLQSVFNIHSTDSSTVLMDELSYWSIAPINMDNLKLELRSKLLLRCKSKSLVHRHLILILVIDLTIDWLPQLLVVFIKQAEKSQGFCNSVSCAK